MTGSLWMHQPLCDILDFAITQVWFRFILKITQTVLSLHKSSFNTKPSTPPVFKPEPTITPPVLKPCRLTLVYNLCRAHVYLLNCEKASPIRNDYLKETFK